MSSCIHSLSVIWRGLPSSEQPKLTWAGQGEALIAPASLLEPTGQALWNLALIVQYPGASKDSPSARVELIGQFVDIYFTEVEGVPADFSAEKSVQSAAEFQIPTTHTLPGYSRLRDMYIRNPSPDKAVHMINLLSFAPKNGKQQYQEYLKACEPALRACGAKLAYHADVVKGQHDTGKQWDSLLIGAYPDKLALIHGVIDPKYMKAFDIRAKALQDAMLLATHPLDLQRYTANVASKL